MKPFSITFAWAALSSWGRPLLVVEVEEYFLLKTWCDMQGMAGKRWIENALSYWSLGNATGGHNGTSQRQWDLRTISGTELIPVTRDPPPPQKKSDIKARGRKSSFVCLFQAPLLKSAAWEGKEKILESGLPSFASTSALCFRFSSCKRKIVRVSVTEALHSKNCLASVLWPKQANSFSDSTWRSHRELP